VIDVALEFGCRFPQIVDKIVANGMLPWFESSLQSYEQVRECTIRAISALFGCHFRIDDPSIPEPVQTLFDNTLLKAGDPFLISWLLTQFTTQTMASFVLNRLCIGKISEWINLCLDKTEDEEKRARVCLLHLMRANWAWACSESPLTIETVQPTIHRIIAQLNPANRVWQTQTVVLLLIESFVCVNFFYFTDDDLESLVRTVVIPALLNTNYDIQDSAAELLAFLLNSSVFIRTLIPELSAEFRKMVFSGASGPIALKLSGVKGLGAIIHSTILFDSVPDYVFDAFVALSEAQEMDSALEPTVSVAFSDFWAVHEENLMPQVADVLTPFRDFVRPRYFC
jgi:hypothetical protein